MDCRDLLHKAAGGHGRRPVRRRTFCCVKHDRSIRHGFENVRKHGRVRLRTEMAPMAPRVSAMIGNLLASAARAYREVVRELFDPYRPELHYMRGPGPRWAEKHGRS